MSACATAGFGAHVGNQIIRYSPLPNAIPEAELDALVAVYGFLLERHTNRKATEIEGAEDIEGGDKDRKPEASTG